MNLYLRALMQVEGQLIFHCTRVAIRYSCNVIADTRDALHEQIPNMPPGLLLLTFTPSSVDVHVLADLLRPHRKRSLMPPSSKDRNGGTDKDKIPVSDYVLGSTRKAVVAVPAQLQKPSSGAYRAAS